MRKSLKYGLLGAAATVALGSFAGSANATPYAFGEETFNNFVVQLGGGASLIGGSLSTTATESYPGSTNSIVSAGSNFGPSGNAGVSSSAGPVFGGPNTTYTIATPAPATTYNPSPVGESTLKGGFGAQAASSVGSLNVFTTPGPTNGDGAYLAAEAGGSPSGTGNGASAAQTESVTLSVVVGSGGGSIDVSSAIQGFIEALTTRVGETATAQMNATLQITLCQGGIVSNNCVNSHVVDTVAPDLLNQNVGLDATTVADETAGSSSFTTFDTTPILLAEGAYKISFQTQVSVTTSSIPEPASLAIFGTGLIGLGFLFSRRQNKQA